MTAPGHSGFCPPHRPAGPSRSFVMRCPEPKRCLSANDLKTKQKNKNSFPETLNCHLLKTYHNKYTDPPACPGCAVRHSTPGGLEAGSECSAHNLWLSSQGGEGGKEVGRRGKRRLVEKGSMTWDNLLLGHRGPLLQDHPIFLRL